jgi:putative SOS response-associated peptidase YedK
MTYLGVAQHGVAKLPIHLVSNRHHFIEHDAEINIAKIHLQGVEDTDLQHSRWGFKREDGKLLFNARAESITDVIFWKESFSLRRCIIPADSFFEWQKVGRQKTEIWVHHPRSKPIWNGRSIGALEESEDQSMGRHLRGRDGGSE